MKKENSKTRYIALLCSFIIVFSVVLTGCGSVKKITQKKSAGSSDEIQIGQGNDILEGPTQIVVGDDGQSFIVDNNGHSVVYNPNQSGNKYTASNITPSNTAPNASTNRQTTTKKTVTKRTYNDKDWLIELWKGEYAMATVGCEVGFYYRDHNQTALDKFGPNNLLYKCVEDQDAMPVSMKLWQYEKAADSTPVQKIDYGKRYCWWAADFETGVLEKHRDQTTLVMVATIEFPTDKMMNLFIDGLEEEGFKEGSINNYHNVERYSVSGKTVTICWKNYDYSKAHS